MHAAVKSCSWGMTNDSRLCLECGGELPATATKRRLFCTKNCGKRHHARAQRATTTMTETDRLRAQLNALRSELGRKESQLAAARETIAAERSRGRRQESKFRKRERRQLAHAQRAIMSRVQTLVATRDRLAVVRSELSEAMTGHVDRSDLEVAARRIVDLQARVKAANERVRTLTGHYEALRDRYVSVVEDHDRAGQVIKELTAERERVQAVIDQWDILAGRLAEAVSGRSGQLPAGDRTIVRTWVDWKRGQTRSPATEQDRSR